MTAIARELDNKLKELDARSADSLERLVREALALVDATNHTLEQLPAGSLDPDFFKSIAKEFGSEPFERPQQGNSENRETW